MGFVPIPRSAPGARFRRVVALGVVVLGVGANALVASTDGAAPGRAEELTAAVAGKVLQSTKPVVEARVFAYQLVERTIQKVLTDGAGRFVFDSLPAGIYKIIAHKPGFEPAVRLLQRSTADQAQLLTFELEKETQGTRASFWTVRSEIPGDVLREIDLPQLAWANESEDETAALAGAGSELKAEVSAIAGVHEIKPQTDVRISGGNVGVAGRLGDVRVFLEGDFQAVESTTLPHGDALAVDGSTRSVSVSVQTPNQGVFDLESIRNRLLTSENGLALPVEASQYRFGWNREVGERGETSFRGHYIEESGLYNKGWIEPVEMPFASRTLLLEGTYSHKLDSGRLRAGLRYRERDGSYTRRYAGSSGESATELLDAFAGGDWQANDAVLLEYGLFTTMHDGSVSLTPRGGVVVQLGGEWQASAAAAHRLAVDEGAVAGAFVPLLVEGALDCSESEIACYELSVLRGSGEGDHVAFGGSYRELDTTVRMFFSGNFFDHSEGLFLVPGDALPELHASFRKRLTPGVVTRVSTSLADGGGGVYRAVNNRLFENNVTLMSTRIDTSFEQTATGVFVAFHRLEQELVPYHPIRRRVAAETAGLERLEVVVNQDLSALLDLSADWAIRLGMELARGASFFHSDVDPSELRRQIMTGVAVRF